MSIGNINEIIGNHEKKGRTIQNISTFQSFNTIILNCGLLEFPCLRHKLSWRGRRKSEIIWCRLDRTLANEDWHELFTQSIVEYLAMVGSDHRPILAAIENKISRGRRQFQFDKRWIGMDGLMELIAMGWGERAGRLEGNVVDKIMVVITRYHDGAIIIPHTERRRLRN